MVPDAASICRLQLDFMKWADERMFSLVRMLDPEVCSRNVGVSFESLAGTVEHIYRAERIWYRRVNGEPTLPFDVIESPSLQELSGLWPQLHEEWRRWAAGLDANDWYRSVFSPTTQTVQGGLFNWQIVLHVVNHGSYHRGQVMSMVRQAGAQPVTTDISAYFRMLAAKG